MLVSHGRAWRGLCNCSTDHQQRTTLIEIVAKETGLSSVSVIQSLFLAANLKLGDAGASSPAETAVPGK